MRYLPNQPIAEHRPNCTLPPAGWIQPVCKTDRTQVQFAIGGCGGEANYMVNGQFAQGGTGWTSSGFTFANNRATTSGGSASLGQTVALPTAQTVIFTFTVTMSVPDLVIASNLGVIDVINQSGTYTYYLTTTGITGIGFLTGGILSISNVSLRLLNDRWRTELRRVSDDGIQTVLPSSAYSSTRGWLTVTAEWSDLNVPDGCYYFQFYDPCRCAQFGFETENFEDVPQNEWTESGSTGNVLFTIGNGLFIADNTASGMRPSVGRRNSALCSGVAYTLTYTLFNMVAGDTFRIRLGTANGILRTGNGTYTENITANGANLDFVFLITALGSVGIQNFTIRAVTPIPVGRSVPFSLSNCQGCTQTLSMCGNYDQLGFGFRDTGFFPTIRLEGTDRVSRYIGERNGYEYSTGTKQVTYGRTRKVREFLFAAPEYVHDFARLLIYSDQAIVGGRQVYIEADEYPSLSGHPDADLAAITLPYSAITELTENVRCSSVKSITCATGGARLILNGNTTVIGGVTFQGQNKRDIITNAGSVITTG